MIPAPAAGAENLKIEIKIGKLLILKKINQSFSKHG
jgi:hypothetical protein